MARWHRSGRFVVLTAVLATIAGAVTLALPGVLASVLLHPVRRTVDRTAPEGCVDMSFNGDDVVLRGWQCPSRSPRRGTVVYLHGIADNRSSASGLAATFPARGFDLIAFDSRAHGDSGGDACTYGYYERRDLQRVLAGIERGPIVLVGVSLGAAVALQTAALDPRVATVVSVDVFSSLRAIVLERAPFFVTGWMARQAFARAEADAAFEVDAIDVVAAARGISVPVFVIHGEADRETSPTHSALVHEALTGRKQLRIVPGAGHSQSVGMRDVWTDIHDWIDRVLPPTP